VPITENHEKNNYDIQKRVLSTIFNNKIIKSLQYIYIYRQEA